MHIHSLIGLFLFLAFASLWGNCDTVMGQSNLSRIQKTDKKDAGPNLSNEVNEFVEFVRSANPPPWDYDRLVAAADAIVIATLQESKNQPRADYRGNALSEGHPNPDSDSFISVDSKFRVKSVLRGKVTEEHITIAHLKWKPTVIVLSDIRLAAFHKQVQIPPLVSTEREGEIAHFGGSSTLTELITPEYLLFLKRRGDGLFELASGQRHAADSVRMVNIVVP